MPASIADRPTARHGSCSGPRSPPDRRRRSPRGGRGAPTPRGERLGRGGRAAAGRGAASQRRHVDLARLCVRCSLTMQRPTWPAGADPRAADPQLAPEPAVLARRRRRAAIAIDMRQAARVVLSALAGVPSRAAVRGRPATTQRRDTFYKVVADLTAAASSSGRTHAATGSCTTSTTAFTTSSSHLHLLGAVLLRVGAVEGIEAVGLWYQRRWAEYLTFLVTASLLPLEIYEIVNRAMRASSCHRPRHQRGVVVYLLRAKRLFGRARRRRPPTGRGRHDRACARARRPRTGAEAASRDCPARRAASARPRRSRGPALEEQAVNPVVLAELGVKGDRQPAGPGGRRPHGRRARARISTSGPCSAIQGARMKTPRSGPPSRPVERRRRPRSCDLAAEGVALAR